MHGAQCGGSFLTAFMGSPPGLPLFLPSLLAVLSEGFPGGKEGKHS